MTDNQEQYEADLIVLMMHEMFTTRLGDVNECEENKIHRTVSNNHSGAVLMIGQLGIDSEMSVDLKFNEFCNVIKATINKERKERFGSIMDKTKEQVLLNVEVRQAQRIISVFFTTANVKLKECKPEDNRAVLHKHLMNSGALWAFALLMGTKDPEEILDKIGKKTGITL